MAKLTAHGCYAVAAWKQGEDRAALRSDGMLLLRVGKRGAYTTWKQAVNRDTAKLLELQGWAGTVANLDAELQEKGWSMTETRAGRYSTHHRQAIYWKELSRRQRRGEV